MLLPFFSSFVFLPVISPKLLKDLNTAHKLQMDWNRKRGVKLLKYVGSQVGGNVTFWWDLPVLNPTSTLFTSGRINYVPDGENGTKIGVFTIFLII